MSEENLDTTAVQRPGAFFGHITQTVRNLAHEYFKTAPKGITLDVGCGNGLFFASLPKPTGKLIGTDLDLSLLYESKQIFADNEVENVSLVQGNVTTMPFENQSFDNIFFLNTLINIPTDEIAAQLLNELMRICRPKGRIFLDIRNGANPILRYRYWRHNSREDFTTRGHHLRHLAGLFATNGFTITQKTAIGPNFPIFALGYFLAAQAPE